MATVKTKELSRLLQNLNKEQLSAVTHGDGPLLIIAGAGTGKTTVITRRISWLIEQGRAQTDEILALTFTEKAATEMAERVDQLMPLGYSEITISTFHAFAQEVLRDHALDIGLPSDFRLLTGTQAWLLIQKHLDEFKLDYYRPMGNPTKFIHSLLDHFDKAKREGVSPEDYLKYAQELQLATDSPNATTKRKRKNPTETETPDPQEVARVQEIADAYHTYQKLLLDEGFLDYNDLIGYTLKLFKSRPKILEQYRRRFKYVLVDEFQDTDLAQYELIKLLSDHHRNITVVGDDDQSIYKFRGASISNILKFEDDYPGLAKVTLVENYRSGQKILDFAYDFIQQNNPERLEAKLKISKKLQSQKFTPGQIEVLHAQTGHEEALRVGDKISELMAGGGLTYNDFAILVRANDHAEVFLSELAARGIPYIFVANRGLYKKPFILDILAYLKLLDNYHESDALFRVLNLEKFRLPVSDLVAVTQTAKKKGMSVYEVLRQAEVLVRISEESQRKIREFLQVLDRDSAQARTLRASEMLLHSLEVLGITHDLAQHSAERSEDIGLLRKLYDKAQEFTAESDDKTIRAFLHMIQLELEAGNTGELAFDPNLGPETVKVMTIHSSKGLEFSAVFMVNLVEARFPTRERKESIELPGALVNEIFSEGDVHLMEERRLFYVAATRAKDYLYLTWAANYGGQLTKKPSRFLVETGLEQPAGAQQATGEVIFKKTAALPLPKFSDLPIPERFSWTSVSAFKKCPLEFKYKYLYQIPWPGNGYLSFGSSIHKAIQLFSDLIRQTASMKQNDLFGAKPGVVEYPPLKKLYEFYDKNWIDEWYRDAKSQAEFKKRGYRLLENYYRRLTGQQLVPAETEKSFFLKIAEYKFTGKIDCIFGDADGSISIVDYKTSKEARTKLQKVDKKQLLIYQLAAQEYLNKKVKHLSYWDLEDLSSVIEFLGTPKELQEMRDELVADIGRIIQTIKTDSFLEEDLQRPSHNCEFRDLE